MALTAAFWCGTDVPVNGGPAGHFDSASPPRAGHGVLGDVRYGDVHTLMEAGASWRVSVRMWEKREKWLKKKR